MQAATEFLPVSSTAHLILIPFFLEWELQKLSFDIAVHLGTLAGLLAYYSKALVQGAPVWHEAPKTRKLFVLVTLASLPLFAAGYLLASYVASYLRTPEIIAYATIFFGIVLLLAEKTNASKGKSHSATLTLKKAFLIGCAQILALIPGASRSGVTLSAGLFLGLTKESAAHFSFIMAIPAILGASAYWLISAETESSLSLPTLALGFFTAAIVSLLSIGIFLRLLKRFGLFPFVIYRFVLGIAILSIY